MGKQQARAPRELAEVVTAAMAFRVAPLLNGVSAA
jgi:hypothetical protein